MRSLAASLCALALLAIAATPGLAFQEYPSLELTPYLGYTIYDGEHDHLHEQSRRWACAWICARSRRSAFSSTTRARRAGRTSPSAGFGEDDYVERVAAQPDARSAAQRGIFVFGSLGVGSFNRHSAELYDNDPSVQAGLGFRRNLVGPLYLRGERRLDRRLPPRPCRGCPLPRAHPDPSPRWRAHLSLLFDN